MKLRVAPTGLDPRTGRIIGLLIVFLVLPLWFGFAWLAGIIRFGPDPTPTGEPVLELVSTRPLGDVLVCIERDYTGRLGPLRSITSPSPDVHRLWDTMSDVIIEISPHADGAVVRAYAKGDRSQNYRHALESCAGA
jgi:hypothetical protein